MEESAVTVIVTVRYGWRGVQPAQNVVTVLRGELLCLAGTGAERRNR